MKITYAQNRTRIVQVAFGSAVAILLVLGAFSYRATVVFSESDRRLQRTHEILENLQQLHFAITNIETIGRGFILTGDEAYLASYPASKLSAERHAAAVRALMVDRPEQQSQFLALEALIAQKIQFQKMVGDLRRAEGLEVAVAAIRSGRGQQITDEFHAVVRRLQDEELRLLAEHNADAEWSLSQTKTILVVGTFLGLLITAAAGWTVQRDSSKRGLAEQALAQMKIMEEALFEEKERAEVTLNCIGDAVMCTDIEGNLTFLNPVAEKLTGWSRQQAVGRPMAEVLRILDATSRETTPNPMEMAVGRDRTLHLPSNCILVRRDGFEIPIEDSVAPIHDREGQATGAVIVFRDVSAARAMALQMAHSAQHDFFDRTTQSRAVQRSRWPGDRFGAASHEKSRGAVFGFGWLQTHQRFSWASDRRQASSIHRKAPGGLRACIGHGEPPGRRRIRRTIVGSGRAGRHGHHGETNAGGGGTGSRDQPARSSRHHQHWRERLSRRRPGCGDAHQERRHRDVPGQGKWAARAISFSSRP